MSTTWKIVIAVIGALGGTSFLGFGVDLYQDYVSPNRLSVQIADEHITSLRQGEIQALLLTFSEFVERHYPQEKKFIESASSPGADIDKIVVERAQYKVDTIQNEVRREVWQLIGHFQSAIRCMDTGRCDREEMSVSFEYPVCKFIDEIAPYLVWARQSNPTYAQTLVEYRERADCAKHRDNPA